MYLVANLLANKISVDFFLYYFVQGSKFNNNNNVFLVIHFSGYLPPLFEELFLYVVVDKFGHILHNQISFDGKCLAFDQ